jgi:hypothetical protein
VLEKIAAPGCLVSFPCLPDAEAAELRAQLAATTIPERHDTRWIDAEPAFAALAPYADVLTTMGRGLEQDREFFIAAGAGAVVALELIGKR